MEIRTATIADAKTVAGMALALLDELAGDQPGECTLAGLTHTATGFLRESAIMALIAEEVGKPVGVVVLNPCASLYAGRFGEITEFYVTPEFRSAGVGAALISAAVATARARGWARLEVGTPELPEWARTAAFYRRNGFVMIGARMKLPL